MKKVTLGDALPHLGIGLRGGYSNFFERDKWNGLAFASLTIPLTQWGQTAHQLKQHNLRIKQAQLMQKDYSEKLNLQNLQVYKQMIEASKLTQQHLSAAELAEDNYNLALMNYRAGVATMTELLEAEALLLQAQNNLTDSRINYRTAMRKYMDYTQHK
jgi:outer membrane protein TolC